MTYSTWLTFAIMVLLLVMSPGPNGIIVLKVLGQNGYKPALVAIFGLFCATFMHGLFVMFGLSALLIHIPQAFTAIKIIGALYLFYLGVKSLKQCFKKGIPKSKLDSHSAPLINNKTESIRSFWKVGFMTQALNPKASAFYLAVIPNFIDLSSSTAKIDTLLLTSTHAVIVGLWFISVASVGMKVLPYFKDKSIGKWMNGVVGTVMVYFSIMLLTYEVKQG